MAAAPDSPLPLKLNRKSVRVLSARLSVRIRPAAPHPAGGVDIRRCRAEDVFPAPPHLTARRARRAIWRTRNRI